MLALEQTSDLPPREEEADSRTPQPTPPTEDKDFEEPTEEFLVIMGKFRVEDAKAERLSLLKKLREGLSPSPTPRVPPFFWHPFFLTLWTSYSCGFAYLITNFICYHIKYISWLIWYKYLLYIFTFLMSACTLALLVFSLFKRSVTNPKLRRKEQLVKEALDGLSERHAGWVGKCGGLQHFRDAGYVNRILEELNKSKR